MFLFSYFAATKRKSSPLPSSDGTCGKDTIASLLASLLEAVRTTVACECVFVRAMVLKALIWMQNPHESFDELKFMIACELSDPTWPSTLLNEVLLTLHARFKVLMSCYHMIYFIVFPFLFFLVLKVNPLMQCLFFCICFSNCQNFLYSF